MTKQDAIALFGSVTQLAHALGITSQALSQWPNQLSTRARREVLGAALEAGLLDRATLGKYADGLSQPTSMKASFT